jgi:integrase
MARVALTQSVVMSAVCPPGKRKIDLWDEHLPNFLAEVRATGGITYHQRYVDEYGKQRSVRIGSAADITCDQARKMAQRIRSEAVLGQNPAARKAEKKAVLTYAELAEKHLAYANNTLKRPDATEGVLRCHLIPAFGKRHIDTISQQDVTDFLAAKLKSGLKPATVEKMRVTLGRSYNLAKRWGLAGADRNPVQGVPRPHGITSRQRFLNDAEQQRLSEAVKASPNPMLAPIVGLLLLTGCRMGELFSARWRDLDLDRKVLNIPISKNNTSRHVPLSSTAIAILKKIPKYEKSEFIVTNPDTMTRFVSIKKSWNSARTSAGLQDVRIHDLRRSAASLFLNSGFDLYTVGNILGHKDYRSTTIYAKVYSDTMLAAVEAGAEKLKGSWA